MHAASPRFVAASQQEKAAALRTSVRMLHNDTGGVCRAAIHSDDAGHVALALCTRAYVCVLRTDASFGTCGPCVSFGLALGTRSSCYTPYRSIVRVEIKRTCVPALPPCEHAPDNEPSQSRASSLY